MLLKLDLPLILAIAPWVWDDTPAVYFVRPLSFSRYIGEFEQDNKQPTGKKKKKNETTPPRTFNNLTTVIIPAKPGWSRIIIFGAQRVKSDDGVVVRDSARRETPIGKLFRKLPSLARSYPQPALSRFRFGLFALSRS